MRNIDQALDLAVESRPSRGLSLTVFGSLVKDPIQFVH